jgi:hypothetical protein
MVLRKMLWLVWQQRKHEVPFMADACFCVQKRKGKSSTLEQNVGIEPFRCLDPFLGSA